MPTMSLEPKVHARHGSLAALLAMLIGVSTWATPALAQRPRDFRDDESAPRLWLGVGVGGAAVQSLAPAPSAGEDALNLSIDVGYRFTPQWGVGLEFGAVLPANGCPDWQCPVNSAEFAPSFTRILAFGEFRPRQSGWRFRAGAGLSRFCYRSHWSDTAWSWVDTVDFALQLLGDDAISNETVGSGGHRCDARMNALGGTVSAGYDWPVRPESPVAMGLQLGVEAANFGANPASDLPAFRHRAVTLLLRLDIN
jgi:hypothetical protein